MALRTRFSLATCAISAVALAFSIGTSVARAGDRPVPKPIPDARFTRQVDTAAEPLTPWEKFVLTHFPAEDIGEVLPQPGTAQNQYGFEGTFRSSASGAERKTLRPPLFEVVEHLSPRLDEKSLRFGVSLAIVYAIIPNVPEDFYLVRVYADGDRYLVTMVDWRGMELPVNLLGLDSHVQFCKPQENDIEGCWGEEGECIVECDHESSFCVQTCLIPVQWPPEWP